MPKPIQDKKPKKKEKKSIAAIISPEQQEAYLKDYYESFSLAKIPDKKKVLKHQELFLLHEKPKLDKGKDIPHLTNIDPRAIYQADILYMPADKPPKKKDAFKYILVVVDVATGHTDAAPLMFIRSNYVHLRSTYVRIHLRSVAASTFNVCSVTFINVHLHSIYIRGYDPKSMQTHCNCTTPDGAYLYRHRQNLDKRKSIWMNRNRNIIHT